MCSLTISRREDCGTCEILDGVWGFRRTKRGLGKVGAAWALGRDDRIGQGGLKEAQGFGMRERGP